MKQHFHYLFMLLFLFFSGVAFGQAPDGTVNAPGSISGATLGGTNDCSLRPSPDNLIQINIPCPGDWQISTCGSDFDTWIYLGTSLCSANLGDDDDNTDCGPNSKQSSITANLSAGTYFVVVEGFHPFPDSAGNYMVNVIDVTPPVITCPPNISVNSDPNQCGASITYSPPVFSDNCAGAVLSQTSGTISGAFNGIGTQNVSFLVTDAGGNQNSCSFSITVTDNQFPTITNCPGDVTVPTLTGQCNAQVSWAEPTTTDNCNIIEWKSTSSPGDFFLIGTKEVDYTSLDENGNLTECTFHVTVVDMEDPVFTGMPSDMTAFTSPGSCTGTASWSAPFVTDNCGVMSTTTTTPPGSSFGIGTNTVVYTTEDFYGNTSSSSFTITIVDNQPPNGICPSDVTVTAASGCSSQATWPNPTHQDNCVSGFISGSTHNSGDVFTVGATTVTYNFSDAQNNTSTCSFVVNVNDGENPDITCPSSDTISTDLGNCSANISYSTPFATDNCSSVSATFVSGLNSGSNYPVGTSIETWQAVDIAGNTSQCSFTITVEDNQMPVLTVPATMTVNSSAGQSGAFVTYTIPTGTDNCPGSTISLSSGGGSGSFFSLGTNTETYTMVDASGNTVTGSFDIIVVDNQAPVITCPSNMTRSNDPSLCSAVVNYSLPTVWDNAPGVVLSQVSGLPQGAAFPVGTSIVTYQAVDIAGNVSTCSFSVTVTDDELPVLSTPSDITVATDPGQPTSTLNYVFPTATDNCGISTLIQSSGLSSGANFPIGSTVESYTATDVHGNSVSGSFSVTVIDLQPPSINCPSNIVVNNDNGDCGGVVVFPAITSSDNSGSTVISQVSGQPNGDFFDLGSTSQTYMATDPSGNTSTCTFSIEVVDNEPPVLPLPADLVINNDPGFGGATVVYASPVGVDNCPGAITTQLAGIGTGGFFPLGNTVETYQVIDANGNVVTGSFNVSVVDGESPQINCPANMTVSTDPGNCSGLVNYTPPSGTDNAPGAVTVISSGLGTGQVFPVGTSTESYTVTDAEGNVATCSFTITIVDNEPPSVSMPGSIITNTDPGLATAVVTYSAPVITDNCGGVTSNQTSGLGSGGNFPLGSTNEVYSFEDASGNTSFGNFTVTVIDNENPVILCPSAITVNIDPGTCGAVVNYTDPVSSDNVPGEVVSLTTGFGTGSFFPVGTQTESYLVVDQAGNSATCSFTVSVVDNNPPTISSCPNNISLNNDPGLCVATANWSNAIAFDNCSGPITFSSSHASGSQFPVGSTSVVVTASDQFGNSSTCNFNVSILDTEGPMMVSCPSDTTISSSLNTCHGTLNWATPVVTDNCGLSSVTSSVPNGSDFLVGITHTVTITAVDNAGNISNCSFDVVSEDTESPSIINCPSDITQYLGGTSCNSVVKWTPPAASDNCSGVSLTSSHPSGGNFDSGTTTITYTATDNNGNFDICTFNVTVLDTVSPVFSSCPSNIPVSTDAGQCGANVSWTVPAIIDNCPGTSLSASHSSGDFFGIGTSSVSYSVTDASGNSDFCSFNITVSDNEPPVLTVTSSFTVGTDLGMNGAIISYSPSTATDNCGTATVNLLSGVPNGGFFPIGTTIQNYQAIDNNGNSVSGSFTITVIDDEAPSIVCPSNVVINNDPTMCGANVIYSAPVATDNSGAVNISFNSGLGSGAFFSVGAHTEQFIATDNNGNTSSCTFQVMVVDNEPPVLALSPNLVINNDNGLAGANVNYNDPIYSDNCGGTVLTLTQGLGDGSFFPLGTTTEGYLVTDAAGNTVNGTFTITVVDNDPPVIVCPANILVDNDADFCNAFVNYIAPVGTDNAPGVTTVLTSGSGPASTFNLGTVTETYTATDASGNMASCSFNITVVDNQPPASPPVADISVLNDLGQAGAVVNYTAPTGTDNCPGLTSSMIAGLPSGSFFPLGTTTINYQFVDATGNMISNSFTITVSDGENPVIACPNDLIINNDPTMCNANVTYPAPTGTDNVPGAITVQTGGIGSGNVFPLGTTMETFTVTDSEGNQSSCNFNITVVDVEPPVLTGGANTTQGNDFGLAGAIVTYNNVSIVDNCPGANVSLSSGIGNGGFFPLGSTTETYTGTDAAGNIVSTSFVVTVIDQDAPVVVCPSNISVNNDSGVCGAAVTYGNPASSDNSGVETTSLIGGLTSGSIFSVGTSTITFESIDGSGNASICNFSITVQDVEAPVPDSIINIVNNNDVGLNGGFVNYTLPNAVDNCGSYTPILTGGLGSGSFYPIGSTTDTYNYVDQYGNVTPVSVLVTVVDIENPIVSCPGNDTISTDVGTCGALHTFGLPGSTDNTGNSTVTQSGGVVSGGFFTLGINNVTFTASDPSGNFASCNYNVIVVDNDAPQIVSCPSDLTVNSLAVCSGVANWTSPSATDACGTVSWSSNFSSGSSFPVGTSVVTYTATDGNGNDASCSFNVIVSDNQNPVLGACPANIVANSQIGDCGAVVTFSNPTASDNCGNASVTASSLSGGFYPLGTTTVAVTATDVAGNTDVCNFNITVNDIEGPSILNCPSDMTVPSGAGKCSGPASWPNIIASDNCGSVSTTSGFTNGGLFPIATTLVTVSATDQAGNVTDCQFNVTVEDVEAPTFINCPNDTILNSSGAGESVHWTPPSVSDNCSQLNLTSNHSPAELFPLGITEVTYVVEDGNGNLTTCSFNIVINGTSCAAPANLVVTNVSPVSAEVSWTVPVGVNVFQIAYRIMGGVWETVDVTGISATITGLSPNSNYEWKVKDLCNNGASTFGFVNGSNFNTPSLNCAQPENLFVSNNTGQSVDLSWTTALPVSDFELQYRPTGLGAAWISVPVSGNSLTLSGLVAGVEYEWMVQDLCWNNGSLFGFSAADTFVTVLATCAQPENLISINVTTDGAELLWTSSVPVALLQVAYREITPGATWSTQNITQNSVVISGLNPGTTYEWKVKDLCNAPASSFGWTAVEMFTTSALSNCAQPENLVVSNVSPTEATFSWTTPVAVNEFMVAYRPQTPGALWSTRVVTGSNSLTVNDLIPNTTYDWKVKDRCNSPASVFGWTSISVFTTQMLNCAQPENLTASNITSDGVDLSWTTAVPVAEFQVAFRPQTPGALWSTRVVNSNSITLTGLMSNTVYDWKVKDQCNSPASVLGWTSISNFQTSGISCSQPENLTASGIAFNEAVVSWTTVIPATNFQLAFRELNAGQQWGTRMVTGNSFLITGLDANTTYEWKVRDQCNNPGTVLGFTGIETFTTGSATCAPAMNMTSNPVSVDSVVLSWTTSIVVGDQQISYRPLGGNWSIMTTGTINGGVLGGLMPNTTYEWRVRDRCNLGGSPVSTFGWQGPETFVTPALRAEEQGASASSASKVEISVYPNPVISNVTVDLMMDGSLEYQIILTDLNGKTLMEESHSGNIGKNSIDVNLSGYAKGIYFLRYLDGVESKNFKLEKK